MRIFGSERIGSIMDKLGAEEGEVITHPLVNRAIANAQKRVEGQNFEIRKHLLEYDAVANDQRPVVSEQRRDLMQSEDIEENLVAIREDVTDNTISGYLPVGSMEEQWDIGGLTKAFENEFWLACPFK